jgi:hypothetical protein
VALVGGRGAGGGRQGHGGVLFRSCLAAGRRCATGTRCGGRGEDRWEEGARGRRGSTSPAVQVTQLKALVAPAPLPALADSADSMASSDLTPETLRAQWLQSGLPLELFQDFYDEMQQVPPEWSSTASTSAAASSSGAAGSSHLPPPAGVSLLHACPIPSLMCCPAVGAAHACNAACACVSRPADPLHGHQAPLSLVQDTPPTGRCICPENIHTLCCVYACPPASRCDCCTGGCCPAAAD